MREDNLVKTYNEDNTIFITGYAKLPTNITAKKLYEVIAVGVEVDPITEVIVDCDCTLATDVAKKFFRKVTRGYCFRDGINPLILKFEKRYCGSARKAIITALKIVYDKWLTYKEKNNN